MSNRRADARSVRLALAQRLRAAADVLLDVPPASVEDPAVDAATLLQALVGHVRESTDSAAAWLLLVAVRGAFPEPGQVHEARRRIEIDSTTEALLWLLDAGHAALRTHRNPRVRLEVVRDAVLVDVDFSARNDLNTGVQRVVRSAAPYWVAERDATLVAWNDASGLRRLAPGEADRVLHWTAPVGTVPVPRELRETLVVPWDSTVVLPEVPARDHCDQLAAVAEMSGNRVSLIGYDCIPVVSADVMPDVEPNRFVRYLSVVKHATLVSGISASAAAEFAGFASMLPSQGLAGPEVTECLLPVDAPPAALRTPAPHPGSELPTVLSVGSHEPRKNHLAVLFAAEVLWREGHHFALRFIGGSSWAAADFDRRVKELQREGHTVRVDRKVTDAELWSTYRDARFTVFPSLHEGYGLPVAESLAVGTPVVTSDYGSTKEIASDGGALLVDPRDDAALVNAMRRMLTDDDLLAELSRAALARRPRTWRDYAIEVWDQLVAPLRSAA